MNRQQESTTLVVFSERLQKARKDAGFKSQDSLAERLGISQGAVSKWELAKNLPEGTQLLDLADLFGTSVDWLLGRSEKTPMVLRDSPGEYKFDDVLKEMDDLKEKVASLDRAIKRLKK